MCETVIEPGASETDAGMKHQGPSTKSQTSTKHEIQILKTRFGSFASWCFDFV
jgi:hypothetical protein